MCSNGEYQVTTFRTGYRKIPLDCIRFNGTALADCVGNITTNLATMEVFMLDYAYIVYSERPRYPVNYNKLRYFIHFSLRICCRMLADKSALCAEWVCSVLQKLCSHYFKSCLPSSPIIIRVSTINNNKPLQLIRLSNVLYHHHIFYQYIRISETIYFHYSTTKFLLLCGCVFMDCFEWKQKYNCIVPYDVSVDNAASLLHISTMCICSCYFDKHTLFFVSSSRIKLYTFVCKLIYYLCVLCNIVNKVDTESLLIKCTVLYGDRRI
jgi:hypothetical protein